MKKLMTTMIGLATLSGVTSAQFEEQIVQRPGLGASSFLGNAVDMHDGLAVLGSNGVGTMTGAVQLYEWDSGTEQWAFAQELTGSGDSPGDAFGSSVAIHGERFVAGMPSAWAGGYGLAGTVRIYERTSVAPYDFTSFGTLYASDAEAGARFGDAVAINNDWLMVGAPDKEWVPALDASGKVYCWERRSGALHWYPTQDMIIRPLSGQTGERFGSSLDMQNVRAIIGAPLGGALVGSTGRAYVYERSSGSWVDEDVLSPSEDAGAFGYSVAIYNDIAVVGAPFDESDDGMHVLSGAVFVFARSGSTWSQVAKLTASDEDDSLLFGLAVAIEGGRVIVGADNEALYVFSRRSLGSGQEWFQSAKLEASDGASGDEYGRHIAIDDERILVGSRLADSGAVSKAGKGYFYHYDDNFAGYCFAEEGDCPCGNDDPLAGCENSEGHGALISAVGSASVSAMDFNIQVSGLPPSAPILAFAGQNAIRVPFKDGLRCTGGGIVRLSVKFADASGNAHYGPTATITKVGVSAGDLRYYQAWYRDPDGPCEEDSNFSNGLRVRFGS